MSSFIYNADCCCSIGERDNEVLKVSAETALVRQDTGEEVDFAYGAVYGIADGVLLVKRTKWTLRKNYEVIAKFDTEEEAKAELKRIVDELAKSNLVVQVKK